MSDATDQALVARVLDGDERAFAELYHRYQPVVSRRLRRVLGRLQDVEDVVQVTFVEAYRSLARFQPDRPFGPWLQGIAFRQVGNHLRKNKRRSWLSYGENQRFEETVAASGRSSEDKAIQGQLVRLLYEAMDQLPPKKRIAFALHELEGMGFTEIGQVVDASPQTVRARILSAKKAINKYMSRVEKRAVTHKLGVAEQTT